MLKYLFKQTYRSLKAQIKNYFPAFVGLVFLGIGVLNFFIIPLYKKGIILLEYSVIITVALCIYQAINIMLIKTNTLSMNPATIHYFCNTPKIDTFLAWCYTKRVISSAILSFILSLFIFGFKISNTDMWFFLISLTFYFVFCSLIKWLKYNDVNRIVLLISYLLSSFAFLLTIGQNKIIMYVASGVLCLMVILFFFFQKRVKINWGKYYYDMLYSEEINSAGKHCNYSEMQRITSEHLAKKQHTIKLYHFPLNNKNALFCKAIIELFRTSKSVLILIAGALILSILLFKTTIFSHIPILKFPQIGMLISIMLTAVLISNIKQIFIDKILTFLEKRKNGLLNPYSNRYIILSYSIVCCLLSTIILLPLCFVFSTGLLKGILIVLGFNAVLVFSFTTINFKAKAILSVLTSFMFFLLAGLFYGGGF